MNELEGRPAELHFTLEITRAATGLKETVEMVGHIVLPPQVPEENKDVCNSQ